MLTSRALFAVAVAVTSAAPAPHIRKPSSLGFKRDTDSGNPFTATFNGFVDDIMSQWKVPGMSIAVIDGDNIFTDGFGHSVLPNVSTTPETLFYIGSTTKAFTAATLANLIDNNTYSELSDGWFTPFSSIIPDDFLLQDEWATKHLTLEDALTHRTGLARHDNSWRSEVDGRPATPKDIVRNFRNLPLSVEPRVKFHYCNLMYVALSHVIETITGKGLGDVMKTLIWQPLGMNTTYMRLEDAKKAPVPMAASYEWSNKSQSYVELPFMEMNSASGAGGIISNVVDYAQWLKSLIVGTGPFSANVHRDIRTPRFIFDTATGQGTDVGLYGLGWIRTSIHGNVAYAHDGSTHANGALVWWLPDLKYGVVILANGAGTSTNAETVIVRRLIEDKLAPKTTYSSEINQSLKDQSRVMNDAIAQANDVLYPNRSKTYIPPSVKPIQLTGKFLNDGYGTLNLAEEPLLEEGDEIVLVANRTGVVFGRQWRFKHVSKDDWALYVMYQGELSIAEFHAAKFIIDGNGEVEALNVRLYDQYKPLNQGTITFNKVL